MTDEGLSVIRFPDRKGNPAIVAHWTVEVGRGVVAAVGYPYIEGDDLEISVILGSEQKGASIKRTYFDAPDGRRLVDFAPFTGTWHGDAKAPSTGEYRFVFDNTGGKGDVTMHLLVTYDKIAPGSMSPR